MALSDSDKIGTAYVELKADMTQLNKDFLTLKAKTEKAGSKMAMGFAKVAGAIFAARAAWNFTKEAKNAARDAEETRSKFDTVFESIKTGANEVADSFAKDFGVAGTTARKLLGDTGDLLVGFGFTEKRALELSKEVNSLAQDLASFTNFEGGAEGASAALTKALLGETESAKSLGIVIRQNTKEFRDQVKELVTTKGLTEQQAKAELILKQAYKQSGKAVGDYARTKDSLANVERRLEEQQKEAMETLGKELVPLFKLFADILSDLLGKAQENTEAFSYLGTGIKIVGSIVAVVVAGVKSLILALGGIGAALVALFSGNFDLASRIATSTFDDIATEAGKAGDQLKELWKDIPKEAEDGAKKTAAVVTDANEEAVKAWEGQKKTVNEIKTAIEKLNEQIDATDFTGKEGVERIRQLALQLAFLEAQLEAIEKIKEAQKAPENENNPLEDYDQEWMDEFKEFGTTLGDVDESLIDIGDTAKTFTDSIQSASTRSIAGWARQLELIKGANTFAGKLLNNILQIAAQAVVLKLLGTFATGGGGLLGMLGGFLNIGEARFGGTFTGGKSGAVKMAAGGSGTVPLGYPNDSFPMLVSSREQFEVKTPAQVSKTDQLFSEMLNAFNGMQKAVMNQPRPINNIKANIDGITFVEEVVEPAQEILNKEKSYGS